MTPLLALLVGCGDRYENYETEETSLEELETEVSTADYRLLEASDTYSQKQNGRVSIAEVSSYLESNPGASSGLLNSDIRRIKDHLLSKVQSSIQSELPDTYRLDQRVFSLTTTFDIESNGQNHGKVSAPFVSLTPTFRYTNNQGQVVATGRARFISIGSVIDIYDAQGRQLGTIKEKIFHSWGFSSQYQILDPQGNQIALSDKFQLLDTSFTVKDNDGDVVASMHRPMINFTGDTWSIDTASESEIDPRIMVMLTPFKTYADQQRSGSSSFDE